MSATVALHHDGSTGFDSQIDEILQDAVEQKKVPGIVAMVATADRVIYRGAAGKRDTTKDTPMTLDSIFRIASMTKPITAVAVMQLVEQGHVKLDADAATYLPELSTVQVLEDLDPNTKRAKLRAPQSPPTIRQLLTHTSGYVYEFFNRKMHHYVASGAVRSILQGDDSCLKAPLMFDPGTRWEYGINFSVLGRIVEKVSGATLEDYFREHIFQPLGMIDTFFNVPPDKQPRVVTVYTHQPEENFVEGPAQPLQSVRFFSGGGGLYSTASDYLKFERMILNRGRQGGRILKSETVAEMSRNQIGNLTLVELPSLMPQFATDPLRIPGSLDKFGLGFGINSNPLEIGRSPGSLAWAGISNTFFWIDLARELCAVLLMQMLPFGDDLAGAVFDQFERAVYASSARAIRPAD